MPKPRHYWLFAAALAVAIVLSSTSGFTAVQPSSIGYPCFSYLEEVYPNNTFAASPQPAPAPTIVVVEQNSYAFISIWLVSFGFGLLAFVIAQYTTARNNLELQLNRSEEWQDEFKQQQAENKAVTDFRIAALEQQVAENRLQDSGIHGHVERLNAQIKYTEMLKREPRSAEIDPPKKVVDPAIESVDEDTENSA